MTLAWQVAPCTRKAAVFAAENWHYSRCFPAGNAGKAVCYGVWEAEQFIGAIVFSRGATPNLGKPYGLGQDECCELTRVALREHSGFVSMYLATALRMLHRDNPGLRLIVSFADPLQGHAGGIYKATNWLYSGTSDSATFFRVPNKPGLLHRRTVGAMGIRQSLTAVKRHISMQAEVVKTPGKHRYLFPLDRKMRKAVQHLAQPYPERLT